MKPTGYIILCITYPTASLGHSINYTADPWQSGSVWVCIPQNCTRRADGLRILSCPSSNSLTSFLPSLSPCIPLCKAAWLTSARKTILLHNCCVYSTCTGHRCFLGCPKQWIHIEVRWSGKGMKAVTLTFPMDSLYFLLSCSKMPSEQELHHTKGCVKTVKNKVQ